MIRVSSDLRRLADRALAFNVQSGQELSMMVKLVTQRQTDLGLHFLHQQFALRYLTYPPTLI